MKKAFLFLILLSPFVSAQDPFDKTQRTAQAAIVAQPSSTNCPTHKKILAEEASFQQLKLVGIIQFPENNKAIFTDKNQQVMLIQKEDVVAQERLQIKDISPQQVTLFDCMQSQFVYLTF